MKDEEFKARLSQIAEFEVRTPKHSPNFRLDSSCVNDVVHRGQFIEINKDYNPSLGVKLIKVKFEKQDCQLGCGKQVQGQIIERRLAMHPDKHWNVRCASCGCYMVNGKRYANSTVAQQAYFKWYNEQKTK